MAINYERKERKMMLIGAVSKDLEALHNKEPEAHEEIVKLSRDISHIINVYMLGNTEHENKNNLFEHRLEK